MSAIVPPVDSIAPGLVTRAPEGSFAVARTLLLGVGVVSLGATILFGWLIGEGQKQFYHSWLVSFMYVLSLALGAMFFVLVQHASRAGWSVVVRRVAENVMATVPLLILLFIPIVVGYETLYHHWVDNIDRVAPDPANGIVGDADYDTILGGKEGYLNVPFFFARVVAFFVIWLGISTWFRNKSIAQDTSGDSTLTLKMARVAAPALLLYGLTLTFAAVDWMMSLDPHWFSTIWGVYYFAGCFMSFMAALALLLMWLRGKGILADVVTTEHYHDVAKLMFAFVVFWTYIAFSQYMLIWYANLPEETLWYQHHLQGNWLTVGVLLIVGHFMVPFVFLMSRHIKRRRLTLALGALFLLCVHWMDLHWIVMPNLHHHVHLSWLDFSSLIGMLGLFLWFVLGRIQSAPLIPERDPRLPESLKFVNH